MNNINNNENTKANIQYILNEDGEMTEMPKKDAKPVEYPIKYRLKNAFEVFVRVNGTENYWISNYGRCVNNLNHKDKNTFFRHKEGKCHYTIFEIEKQIVSFPALRRKNGTRKVDRTKKRAEKTISCSLSEEECSRILEEMQNNNESRMYSLESTRYKRETTPEDLVAETFLVQYKGRCRVWHKDGDESNNWYKNLLYITPQDYKDLKSGKTTWQDLNLEQGYIEYENKASQSAYQVYDCVKVRCGYTEDKDYVRNCYNKSVMWKGWIDEPKEFVKWYLEHYYEVDDEEMDVDKDLFGDGSGMYHPDFCCVLPKGLNTMLANAKKHYGEGQEQDNVLPLGVRYSGKTDKYYGEIIFSGAEKTILLSEWNTPEEAFAEYKIMKQADICMMAAKYKESIPDCIYERLLKVDVKPY